MCTPSGVNQEKARSCLKRRISHEMLPLLPRPSHFPAMIKCQTDSFQQPSLSLLSPIPPLQPLSSTVMTFRGVCCERPGPQMQSHSSFYPSHSFKDSLLTNAALQNNIISSVSPVCITAIVRKAALCYWWSSPQSVEGHRVNDPQMLDCVQTQQCLWWINQRAFQSHGSC